MARMGANFSGMTSPVAFFPQRSEHRCVATSNVILLDLPMQHTTHFSLRAKRKRTFLSLVGPLLRLLMLTGFYHPKNRLGNLH